MSVRTVPTENYEPGTRPEKSGVNILTNHDCQNAHFVPLKVDYRWTNSLSSRIPHLVHDKSTTDCIGTNNVLFNLLCSWSVLTPPYVASIASHYLCRLPYPHMLPAQRHIICSYVVEHKAETSAASSTLWVVERDGTLTVPCPCIQTHRTHTDSAGNRP